jgi:predicted phosphoadenosine phosphosulfate sulfurtransferase
VLKIKRNYASTLLRFYEISDRQTARTDTYEFFDLPDWQKRKLYTERIKSMTITNQILDVTFITGLTYILNIQELPIWIEDQMDILSTYRNVVNDEIQLIKI